VQAFLRDDLLAFCREAPPEFNNHQRDVFCVFSGGGVGRLRDYLNQEKALQLADGDEDSVTPSMAGEDDMGPDGDDGDNTGDSEGSNTPVISLNIHSTHPAGGTPVLHGPREGSSSGVLFASAHHPAWQPYGHGNDAAGSSTARLSQSAPSSTTQVFGPHLWGGTGSATTSHHPFIPPLPQQMQQHGLSQHFGQHQQQHGQHGTAQHVTGMMSAAMLDDVDEGDEAYGESSEILED